MVYHRLILFVCLTAASSCSAFAPLGFTGAAQRSLHLTSSGIDSLYSRPGNTGSSVKSNGSSYDSHSTTSNSSGRTITLDVGGRLFEISTDTLMNSGSQYFRGLLEDSGATYWSTTSSHTSSQPLFVDSDPDLFSDVLDFMQRGSIRPEVKLNLRHLQAIRAEAQHFSYHALQQACDEAIKRIDKTGSSERGMHLTQRRTQQNNGNRFLSEIGARGSEWDRIREDYYEPKHQLRVDHRGAGWDRDRSHDRYDDYYSYSRSNPRLFPENRPRQKSHMVEIGQRKSDWDAAERELHHEPGVDDIGWNRINKSNYSPTYREEHRHRSEMGVRGSDRDGSTRNLSYEQRSAGARGWNRSNDSYSTSYPRIVPPEDRPPVKDHMVEMGARNSDWDGAKRELNHRPGVDDIGARRSNEGRIYNDNYSLANPHIFPEDRHRMNRPVVEMFQRGSDWDRIVREPHEKPQRGVYKQ